MAAGPDDAIYESLEVEEAGDEDEPRFIIKRDGATQAEVLWDTVVTADPDAPELGGRWFFSGTWGHEEPWPEIPRDARDEAVERAKSKVVDHLL
jgi:hypothetical protein